MRKALALALLVSISAAVVPAFSASPPSFKQATTDYQAGKFQVALIEFEKFRESYPTNLMVHYYEALCYQGLNQLESARTEFQYVIENDDSGTLKAKAEAGLKRVNDAHTSSTASSASRNSSGAPGAPVTMAGFGRRMEPGKLWCVLEFLDKDLCKDCQALAPHVYFASCRFGEIPFFRIIVDQGNDPRIAQYNPEKKHPWLVFLDGSQPVQKVLWKGVVPPVQAKVVAQVARYRNLRPTAPNIPGNTYPYGSAQTLQIPNPPGQSNPAYNNANPNIQTNVPDPNNPYTNNPYNGDKPNNTTNPNVNPYINPNIQY